jgi:hypothetical protein
MSRSRTDSEMDSWFGRALKEKERGLRAPPGMGERIMEEGRQGRRGDRESEGGSWLYWLISKILCYFVVFVLRCVFVGGACSWVILLGCALFFFFYFCWWYWGLNPGLHPC